MTINLQMLQRVATLKLKDPALSEKTIAQILSFRGTRRPPDESKVRPDSAVVLSSIASTLAEMCKRRFETKQELRQAVFLLELTNQQALRLIPKVDNPVARGQLLAHSSLIGNWIEIARHNISQI